VNRRRLVVVLAITLPLVLASVALLAWAGPYWIGQARDVAARNRWPEQREQIEDAVAGLTLPAGYRETACDAHLAGDAARCWWTDALPDDTAADLEAALVAVAATDVTSDAVAGDGAPGAGGTAGATGTGEAVLLVATGSVGGRQIHLVAGRELDEEATLAAGDVVRRPGSLVRLVADLDAP
jgi:hypothetical protein